MHQPRSLLVPGLATAIGAVATAGVVLAAGPGQAADSATSYPADKMTVSGSALEVTGPDTSVEVLSAHLRTSAPEDLVLSLSAECDILTQIHNMGNQADTEHSFAQIEMWVTIDGTVVPVSADDGSDPGKVVFCNRTHDATSQFASQDAFYQSFLETRTANAFQWVALNVGNGVHFIQVFADLSQEVSGQNVNMDQAQAVIGKRTLVVDPTKAAHDETAVTSSNNG